MGTFTLILKVDKRHFYHCVMATWLKPCQYLIQRICKFSQSRGLVLLDFTQTLVRMSLAAWSVLKGLDNLRLPEPLLKIGADEPFSVLVGSVESESFLFLLVDADRDADIFSYSTLNRICFKTPTKSSSTLCSIPAEVSMNLASHDLAKALPSVKWKWKLIYSDQNINRHFLSTVWKFHDFSITQQMQNLPFWHI